MAYSFRMDPTPAIEFRGVVKDYGRTRALAGIDLRIERGRIFGFLGPNGAGKTTAIRILLDLIRPTAGAASVLGFDCQRQSIEVRERTGYLPGDLRLYDSMHGDAFLDLIDSFRPGRRDPAYRRGLCERLGLDVTRPIRALSKGNRQKIQLLHAFSTRADLLVLDEPTSGLDPLMEIAFRDTVHEAKARGQAVFLSSHILSEVEALCDRVGILRAGRLVDEGTLEQLRRLHTQTLDVTFADVAPEIARLDHLDHVIATPLGPNAIRFEVSGTVGPLLSRLADYDVVALEAREPSLEEVFLHHYGDGDGDSG